MRVEKLLPHHVENFLTQDIRPADLEEWLDGIGKHPREALPLMLASMPRRHVARALVMDDGAVVALWGCTVTGLPGKQVGTIWLIATNYNLALAPVIHHTFAREEMPMLMAMAKTINAYPSSKNTVHHKWLEHFGFRKVGEVVMGTAGVPFFHYQHRARHNHVL